MSNRHALLHKGEKRFNRNGTEYEVLEVYDRDTYLMRSSGGWVFTAHVITQYTDNTIEWDYSSGGCFI